MIPATVPCKCGNAVEIRGGSFDVVGTDRKGQRYERNEIWFAGGMCRCGRVIQYGWNGEAQDYMHGRFWYIGKEAEPAPGRVRRWPADWGRPDDSGISIQ